MPEGRREATLHQLGISAGRDETVPRVRWDEFWGEGGIKLSQVNFSDPAFQAEARANLVAGGRILTPRSLEVEMWGILGEYLELDL